MQLHALHTYTWPSSYSRRAYDVRTSKHHSFSMMVGLIGIGKVFVSSILKFSILFNIMAIQAQKGSQAEKSFCYTKDYTCVYT